MSHILLIESNTVLARAYTQALVHAGHTVDHVVGAQAGINAADKKQPGLVMIELQLPQHNGIEFLHEFRSYAEWSEIPVIAITNMPPARIMQAKTSLERDLGVRAIRYKPRTTLQDIVRLAREYSVGV